MARLLFLTSSFPSSPEDGVCGYVYDLARRMVETYGHEAHVVAPAAQRIELDRDAAFAPVRVERFVHPWPVERRLRAELDLGAAIGSSAVARAEALAFVATLARAAQRAAQSADVICSHWLVPAGAAGAMLRRARRPHIAIAHGGDVHLLGRIPGGAHLARKIVARTDRLLCVSRDLKSRLEALAPDARQKIAVVPMGAEIGPPASSAEVDVLRKRFGRADRTTLLFLGRLLPIKGVDVLLDAAALVPDVSFWIAGDGPEFERLRDRAQAARLHVSFFGRVDRTLRRALLDACDAVVVPSRIEATGRMEGTPVVCAESYAAGKPIIATHTGGIVEVVEHERTGLLVAPGDPQALATAIARFARDKTLSRRLATHAAERGIDYSSATTATRFAEALTQIRL